MAKRRELGLTTPPTGTWVQTDRAAHERWAALTLSHPRAAALLHLMVANMGRGNALVASQQTLAKLAGCSLRTTQYALNTLREQRWIDVVRIGAAGTTNAYLINSRAVWAGNRDAIRYSLFSATVLASADEQPASALNDRRPLQPLPALYPDERQLPTGPGLPPPADPALPGLEPDLPTRKRRQSP